MLYICQLVQSNISQYLNSDEGGPAKKDGEEK